MESGSGTENTGNDGMENIYEDMFYNNDQRKPQFVCSTQPLSLLLSRDSYLCFDGDFFGLYYPWRSQDELPVVSKQHEAYKKFAESQGAYEVPCKLEQNRLMQLFLTHMFPLFPVVPRVSLKNTDEIPLLLLNALMLCATRFDTTGTIPIRARVQQFYNRCKLLENIEQNKITLIQSYLLLSINEEGISGARDSKEYITKASNLCGELCITNISGANDLSQSLSEQTNGVDLKYRKGFLRRLFWISYGLDRLISATSGREMYFDRRDLIIDDLVIEDFEPDENRMSDFAACKEMLKLSMLVERVQSSLYRPPIHRDEDTGLKQDILDWKIENLDLIPSSIAKLLMIYHSYIAVLTFRCQIDTVGLILQRNGSGIRKISDEDFLQQFSTKIMELTKSENVVHHVLVVHAVLHVIALIELESNVTNDKDELYHRYYTEMTESANVVLENLKKYWWFAGAALRLCNIIWSEKGRE